MGLMGAGVSTAAAVLRMNWPRVLDIHTKEANSKEASNLTLSIPAVRLNYERPTQHTLSLRGNRNQSINQSIADDEIREGQKKESTEKRREKG